MPLDAEDIGLAELFQAQRARHEANEHRLDSIATRVHRSLRWQAFALGAYAATLVITIAALVFLYEQRASDRGNQRDQQVQVQCAALSAVIDAGRQVIISQTAQPVPPREERALERLGVPNAKTRRQQAEAAANAYAAKVAQAIAAQTSVTGIIRKDGSLNCQKLTGVGN